MGKVDFDKFLIDYVNSGFSKKRMAVNYLLEEQGLQIVKDEIVPIKDNKEPKFKVGDWVTDGIAKCQILFIDDTLYWYSENCILGSIESIDKKYHLWTIQDAKAGNIIVDCYNNVCIFKNGDNDIWQSLGYLGSYSNEFVCNGFHSSCSCHPATQEQCDLLFIKIREAGYEWNAEGLKLEKIEQRHAWSEEDIMRIDNLIAIIEHRGYPDYVDYLEKLKERYTWKPSDEQMEALRIARDRNDKIGFYLSQLYDDIKKLM